MNARQQHRAQLLSTINHERIVIGRQIDKVRQLPAQLSQLSQFANLGGLNSGMNRHHGHGASLVLSALGTLGVYLLKRHFSSSARSDPTRR